MLKIILIREKRKNLIFQHLKQDNIKIDNKNIRINKNPKKDVLILEEKTTSPHIVKEKNHQVDNTKKN